MAVALLLGIGFFSEGMMFVNQSVSSAIIVIALRSHGTGVGAAARCLGRRRGRAGDRRRPVPAGPDRRDPHRRARGAALAVGRAGARRRAARRAHACRARAGRSPPPRTSTASWRRWRRLGPPRAQPRGSRRDAGASAPRSPPRTPASASSTCSRTPRSACSASRPTRSRPPRPRPTSSAPPIDVLAGALAALTRSPQPWSDELLTAIRADVGSDDRRRSPRRPRRARRCSPR